MDFLKLLIILVFITSCSTTRTRIFKKLDAVDYKTNPNDYIGKKLIESKDGFRDCYTQFLKRDSDTTPSRKVTLAFRIDENGLVTRADTNNTSLSIGLKYCVLNVLRDIRFPPPKDGKGVDVKQPFNFYPKRI
jgi:hypothetical protein